MTFEEPAITEEGEQTMLVAEVSCATEKLKLPTKNGG
jgi:hypothetical protein